MIVNRLLGSASILVSVHQTLLITASAIFAVKSQLLTLLNVVFNRVKIFSLTYFSYLKPNCRRMFPVIFSKPIIIISSPVSNPREVYVNIPVSRLVDLESPSFDVIWLKVPLNTICIFICFVYLSPNLNSTQPFWHFDRVWWNDLSSFYIELPSSAS